MMLEQYFLFLFVIVFSYSYFLKKRYPTHYPPHPFLTFPIVGDLWCLRSGFTSGIKKMKVRFGDIFGFLLGNQRVVVLSNYDLILEAGKKWDMSGRIFNPVRAQAKGSEDPWDLDKMPGVVMSHGQVWQEQRKFMIHMLKMGFKESNSQKLLMDAIKDVCSILRASNGKPYNLKIEFNLISTKLFWKLCTGENLPLDDTKLLNKIFSLRKNLMQRAETFHKFLISYPTLAVKFKEFNVWNSEKGVEDLLSYVQSTILKSMTTTTSLSSSKGLIGGYLRKIEKQSSSKEETSFVGRNGHINLANVVYEIIVAGSHAPSVIIKWAMFFMILHPEVQEKVHNELDVNIGKGVQPCISDKKKTPFIQAVLLEVYRLGTVTAQGLIHQTMNDTFLSTGHHIPKDTMIIMWLGEAMKDPKYFKNPNMFDPNRFLSDNGMFVSHPGVIPFGLGRRRCPGEFIVKDLVYLTFTGLMARFKVESAMGQDENLVHMTPDNLPPFQLKFIPRENI